MIKPLTIRNFQQLILPYKKELKPLKASLKKVTQ